MGSDGARNGQKKLLLKKAHEALPEGGAVIVYEAIIDDDRSQNAFGLLGTNVMRFVENQRKTSRATSRLKAAPQRTVPEQRRT